MLIDSAIYNILIADAGVTNLVAGRIFSGRVPDSVRTWPSIAYRGEGRKHIVDTLDGGCALSEVHIAVLAGGQSYGQAAEVDSAVELALHEYAGTVSTTTLSPAESITVQRIFLSLPAHEYHYDDVTKIHNFISVFTCHFIDPLRLTA